ncbi:hypothetical protein AX774_g2495 [Zancudomyces culisetae]|uniref:Uncharacterized protein n=1 Tax=Zancudomyces culisetae TaxID=1213189 RepID=A0A1R1PSS5_ZANCU|nr:hypothetical protein AX774_g2495 [Zancudomyces culisetae]|eukprot:OMH83994.1 hypothetical protein AX774_g2495 [Zancudomyces culisetae]
MAVEQSQQQQGPRGMGMSVGMGMGAGGGAGVHNLPPQYAQGMYGGHQTGIGMVNQQQLQQQQQQQQQDSNIYIPKNHCRPWRVPLCNITSKTAQDSSQYTEQRDPANGRKPIGAAAQECGEMLPAAGR